MPKKAYSEQEVEALRIKIMDEASRIMALEGIANISMRRLSAQLGMTAPNLYNYFPSKHDLFLKTSLRGFELLSRDMEAVTEGIKDPRERLRAILKASFVFAKNHLGYWELIFHPPISMRELEGTPFIEVVQVLRQKTFDLMMKSVYAVSDAYTDETGSLPIRAITAMTNVHGLIDLYNHQLLAQLGDEVEQMVEHLIDASLNLIFPLQARVS